MKKDLISLSISATNANKGITIDVTSIARPLNVAWHWDGHFLNTLLVNHTFSLCLLLILFRYAMDKVKIFLSNVQLTQLASVYPRVKVSMMRAAFSGMQPRFSYIRSLPFLHLAY